jgi:hypothetical protein
LESAEQCGERNPGSGSGRTQLRVMLFIFNIQRRP